MPNSSFPYDASSEQAFKSNPLSGYLETGLVTIKLVWNYL